MEQMSGSPKKSTRRGLPLWLLFVLCGVIIMMTVAILFMVFLHFQVIRCVPVNAPSAEATPTAAVTDAPTLPPVENPTPENNATEAPTAEPTAEPTPEPTEEPTPEPTVVPDSFMFGGKKIKTGETKINGKKLGINGKKNNLTHITPEEVEDLVALCPDLEELDLDYCFMDDYEPLGNLRKLKTLQLSSCGAGEGNAIVDIDWLEDLTELQSLNLVHNKIEDTTALENLTKVTYLNLGDNPLEDEDLEPIGKMTNLETLYLYDLKKITDVEPLSDLTKLTFLHVGRNSKLKNVKPLTSLKKLQYLRLNHTKVADLSYFDKFAALKKLDLSKCPIDTSTVYHLRDCKKLDKVVLEMSDVDTYNAIVDLFYDGFQLHFLYNWSE